MFDIFGKHSRRRFILTTKIYQWRNDRLYRSLISPLLNLKKRKDLSIIFIQSLFSAMKTIIRKNLYSSLVEPIQNETRDAVFLGAGKIS
jgi:hypothetical protein